MEFFNFEISGFYFINLSIIYIDIFWKVYFTFHVNEDQIKRINL